MKVFNSIGTPPKWISIWTTWRHKLVTESWEGRQSRLAPAQHLPFDEHLSLGKDLISWSMAPCTHPVHVVRVSSRSCDRNSFTTTAASALTAQFNNIGGRAPYHKILKSLNILSSKYDEDVWFYLMKCCKKIWLIIELTFSVENWSHTIVQFSIQRRAL